MRNSQTLSSFDSCKQSDKSLAFHLSDLMRIYVYCRDKIIMTNYKMVTGWPDDCFGTSKAEHCLCGGYVIFFIGILFATKEGGLHCETHCCLLVFLNLNFQ